MSLFGADDSESAPLDTAQPQGLEGFIEQFAGISESFWFYHDTIEVKFDKVEHQYFLVDPDLGNLIPLLNVSTVCHIIDKSEALVPWASKMAIEKMLRLIPTYNAELDPSKPPLISLKYMTLEEFTNLALEAKKAHKDKLEDAGAVGKEAHEWIENYIKAVMKGDTSVVEMLLHTMCKDPRATNAANAALLWMRAHNVRWKETERKVYSKKHQCSGTMDGLCIVDSCTDKTCCPEEFKDRLSIADWKTSNYLYIEYLFQTAAYEGFYEEEFEIDVEDRWILRLGKDDGEFEAWHLEARHFQEDYEGFLTCLALTRIVDSVNDRMKEHKRVAREAKKAARAIQKAADKAAEKIRKAEEKAAAKLVREEEKKRIKAEAKIERERLRAQVKAEKEFMGVSPVNSKLLSAEVQKLDSTHEEGAEVSVGLAPSQAAAPALSLTPIEAAVVIEALVNPPEPAPTAVQAAARYEEEIEYKPFVIPED